ncbi:MAG: transglutaminase family protein [Deltaproteobacteria bacterium]|nr:transglutaminase family protein [Deltaproteobacteria bacterium]
MSIHIALHHATHYQYDRPITLGPQVVRLRPAPHCRTRILSYSLRVLPTTHFINWQQDPQANYLARLMFLEPTREFRVEVDLVAEMAVINPFDFFLEPSAEHFPFSYDPELLIELAPYRAREPVTPLFARYLAGTAREKTMMVPFLADLNRRLAGDIQYLIRLEPGVQTPEETLEKRAGSCRDSGWLLVQLLRHLGFAARFVSGYLIQLTADVKSLDGPSGPEKDFTDLHAWAEVYLPGAGWVGMDPTSGLFAGEGHLPLACSPMPSSAAPITGTLDACEVTFSHQMTVSRIWEAPRVTKPYTEEEWRIITRLGDAVDADLQAQDVRLTMGGEPTFVAIDDPDGEEWNTTAVGPTKKKLATDLYRRLRERYGARGLVHFSQGKWYPGEQLPRWSLNCFWRGDGEPLWKNDTLIADESHPGKATVATAEAFLREVTVRLGLDEQSPFPAYEDALYFVWRERSLPINVNLADLEETHLDDPLERERLRRVFSRGLTQAVGYVLPLSRDPLTERWQSSSWFLREKRCHLILGDSPLGYRLPLDSLPWVKKTEYPYLHPADPTAPRDPLAPHEEIHEQMNPLSEAHPSYRTPTGRMSVAESPVPAPMPPEVGESADKIARTALCAEARDGILYIFMPPVQALEHYLEIVAAVEATAEHQRQPVLLEGYEPPRDPRLVRFQITPDPGVIEVNIHPAAGWEELVERITFLYDAARQSRLTSEKFMLDGRHTGTGGGNHFAMGAATPTDSPWLRRPDLLRSMLSYWHTHPSLSYLFSGLFIGPTSQAPRIDEARNDAVAEIEIAFREMERQTDVHGDGCPPWLVDRLLRNLLVDVSGNTHRAEFCIDKLYSPDSASGRLGLLEMRAFEMPPHARMSLTQQLLLRALVARFWRTPYAPPRLVRWGTELHDRFLLPHFVWLDFVDVLGELHEAGYSFDARWFASHFEFRFPLYGEFATRGMTLELRGALEPWHVMGEQGAPGGTVRYVDSSLERLQVKATGMPPERYAITCNGVPLPMQPTGTSGEFVAGVRYRAWQPETALHPTIKVHTPLTIDIVDRWMARSLGGCQYHVTHPGGRHYEAVPVNAFEAESRRLARFFRIGHTQGRMELALPRVDPEFPFTLDLRKG